MQRTSRQRLVTASTHAIIRAVLMVAPAIARFKVTLIALPEDNAGLRVPTTHYISAAIGIIIVVLGPVANAVPTQIGIVTASAGIIWAIVNSSRVVGSITPEGIL